MFHKAVETENRCFQHGMAVGFGTSGPTLHRGSNDMGPRSCILTKGLVAHSLPQFSDRDTTTTICLSYAVDKREQRIVAASI